MAEKRSMTITQNDDDDGASTSSTKRPETWSDLNHDLLRLVMMQLGVADYYSFRRVGKSWRSLACKNENMFIASKPPTSMSIFHPRNSLTISCHLEDFEGRKFKTILPNFVGGALVGLTCGYLIFFTRATRDFCLVNPITRKQLHFPDFPFNYLQARGRRAILVFSSSFSRLVLVVLSTGVKRGCPNYICYSLEGEGAWNRFSYHCSIIDLYAFKGKIYTLNSSIPYHLCELRLGPQPNLISIETKTPYLYYPDEFESSDEFVSSEFVSSRESLYVKCCTRKDPHSLLELDFGKMEWVKPCEKTLQEYAFFCCALDRSVAVKRESWADPRSHERYAYTHNNGKIRFFTAKMWHFPHECMNVDLIDE